jgi:hypothetical protein
MTLSQLLQSLSDVERDFIANLDYGADSGKHRTALDAVIERHGDVDFETQGVWYPYEVIELGKNCLKEGHEREYAACMGIVLKNIESGRDRVNDIEHILAQHDDTVRALPCDMRDMLDSQIERVIRKSEPLTVYSCETQQSQLINQRLSRDLWQYPGWWTHVPSLQVTVGARRRNRFRLRSFNGTSTFIKLQELGCV